jgi:hypothetical protein
MLKNLTLHVESYFMYVLGVSRLALFLQFYYWIVDSVVFHHSILMVARDSHPYVARLHDIDVPELLICFTLSAQ